MIVGPIKFDQCAEGEGLVKYFNEFQWVPASSLKVMHSDTMPDQGYLRFVI